MDERLQHLQRAADEGGVEARLELLHALRRTGRPLGEAWTDVPVEVDLAPREASDAVLAVLANIDAGRTLAYVDQSPIRLTEVEGHTLVVRSEEGVLQLTVRVASPRESFPDRLSLLPTHLWSLSEDRPLALAATGEILAQLRGSGALELGSADELRWGTPRWRRPAGERRAHALEVVADEVLLVGQQLHYFARASGEPRRQVSLGRTVCCADLRDGWALVLSDSGLALYSPDGRSYWERQSPVQGRSVAIGSELVAVCDGDVQLFRRSSGQFVATVVLRATELGVYEDVEHQVTHEVEETTEFFASASWLAPDRLLVLDVIQGQLSEWRVGLGAPQRLRSWELSRADAEDQLVGEEGHGHVVWGPHAAHDALTKGVLDWPDSLITAAALSRNTVWLAHSDGTLGRERLSD